MTEQWRIKKYYGKRVLIDVGRILDSSVVDSLLCITGPQLEMLRNLTQYLHRRSTFVDEYSDISYSIADNDDWDSIQAIVAELEETLMGCDEITAQLEAIARAASGLSGPTTITNSMISHYVTEGAVQYEDDFREETTSGDAARCGTAQLAWWFAYEVITEIVQPAQAGAADLLLPLAVAAIVSMVGTPAIGIPAGGVLAVLSAINGSWVEGRLTDVANALFSAKDELVCAMYSALEETSGAASKAAYAVIDGLGAWTAADKLLGKMLLAPWVLAKMDAARVAATTWATNRIDAGYCSECDEVIEGTDWYARQIPAIDGVHTINHPEGDYWEYACHEFWQGTDEICCGMIFEITDFTGSCVTSRTGPATANCDGLYGITQNTTEELSALEYFSVVPDYIDEAECKTQLAPTSTTMTHGIRTAWDGFNYAAWGLGANCTGAITYTVKYLIFEGSPPA